jgi:hypothetical protein
MLPAIHVHSIFWYVNSIVSVVPSCSLLAMFAFVSFTVMYGVPPCV